MAEEEIKNVEMIRDRSNSDQQPQTEASSTTSSPVSPIDYAPSPATCSHALTRANQLRIQALLRQLLTGSGGGEQQCDRVATLRVLRKTLRKLDYQLSWLTQLDLFETMERLLREESSNIDEWRLVNDCTQLLIEAIPQTSHFELDNQTLAQIFSNVIQNLGHQRSEVRRSSLLLLNMYIHKRPAHFQALLNLFIDYGLANHRNPEAQRGAILSLPLLMSEQVIEGEDLSPLIKCLGELLVDAQAQLFYSLYLALQRLHLTLGDAQFATYLRQCNPEVTLLYKQAASRNNSLVNSAPIGEHHNTSNKQRRVSGSRTKVEVSETESANSEQQAKQVTFEADQKEESKEETKQRSNSSDSSSSSSGSSSLATINSNLSDSLLVDDLFVGETEGNTEATSDRKRTLSSVTSSSQSSSRYSATSHHIKVTERVESSVSSTCSSEANLVDPVHYMTPAALSGRPLANFEKIHHIDHSPNGLAINDLGVCCTPTVELGPAAQSELKFGIFPRHLVSAALGGDHHHHHHGVKGGRFQVSIAGQVGDRLEALEQMMCIIRESPINHLAILITYFDSFLEQFLARLMEPNQTGSSYKLELVGIDMIETIVIKTKISTVQYIRPLISLLMRTLAAEVNSSDESSSRSLLLRNNISRVMNKMMAYLPPQHVLDAIFEHKHSKSSLVREETLNRTTAAVLEFDRQEFNLTRLCYHALPMLADHQAHVRLAALECIATLAHALGPERIGSLLTAAEAVQTGCNYDGLLDAIHARLSRRSLPRCNADGSIRYIIKPFLIANHQHQEQQAADVRWILEAPSSHQHVAQALEPPFQPARHPQPHRLGAYSPPAESLRRRRSSLGNAAFSLAGSHSPATAEHAHHHVGSSSNQQQQKHRRSSIKATECNGSSEGNNCSGSERRTTQEESSTLNDESNSRKDSKQRDTSESSENSAKKLRACRTSRPRSNSQDSSSSSDAILPSDSLIYTDATQAYALSRYQSRQQQTSFDYDSDSVGRVPNSVGPTKKPDAKIEREDTQVKLPAKERSCSSTGSESLLTVMESAATMRQKDLATEDRRNSVKLRRQNSKQQVAAEQVQRRKSTVSIGSQRRQSISNKSNNASERPEEHSNEPQQRRASHLPTKQSASEESANSDGSVAGSVKQPDESPEKFGDPTEQRQQSHDGDHKQFNGTENNQPEERAEVQSSDGAQSATQDNDDELGTQTDEISTRKHRSRKPKMARERNQEEEVEEVDEAEKGTNETRRRESRSQPAVGRRAKPTQMLRTTSRSQFEGAPPAAVPVSGRSNRRAGTPSESCSRRAVSVSPIVAGVANNCANIRQILENVAQTEGAFWDSELALRVALDALDGPSWSGKVEGILALVRLAAHHASTVQAHLHEIVGRLVVETRNLRSTVARSAIFALGDLSRRLKRATEPEVDSIVKALLQKSIENTAFIRDDVRRALEALIDESAQLSQWRLASSLINHGSQHKSMHVRRMAANFLAKLVERMGAAKCLVGARDISGQLIPAAARFAQDSSPHTRYFGRVILTRLVQHGAFDRLARKTLQPSLYRSTIGVIEAVKRRGPGEPPPEH